MLGGDFIKNITGMHIYYYMVCKRKLWYFSNMLNMESENESVQLGKIIDESTYTREEKHININDVINIDFIRNDTIFETKKSRKIEEASIMQMKYYLYYLKINGADNFTGEITYPALKQKIQVSIDENDIQNIECICSEIRDIISKPLPPVYEKKSYCKSCAYYDLCMI